jgi:DNA-binding response OmpR family regulator
MAPMSGLELIKKMRDLADPVLSQTAVIMLTGNGDEGTVAEALKLGIAGYLLKPVSAKDLRGRIEAVIKRGLPGFEAAQASGRAAL